MIAKMLSMLPLFVLGLATNLRLHVRAQASLQM